MIGPRLTTVFGFWPSLSASHHVVTAFGWHVYRFSTLTPYPGSQAANKSYCERIKLLQSVGAAKAVVTGVHDVTMPPFVSGVLYATGFGVGLIVAWFYHITKCTTIYNGGEEKEDICVITITRDSSRLRAGPGGPVIRKLLAFEAR